MEVLLAGELGSARVIVLRVHGPLSCVPGFDRLRAMCVERGQSLVLVSGTGELSPEFSQTVNVPGDVMETATSYLALGGVNNFAELFRFLSDRLMLTGHGYAPPSLMPEHGIYLPDMDVAEIGDWERQADPLKPTVAVLFYRAHRMSGNTAFIDTLAQALQAEGVNALCIFTSSLKSKEAGRPAAFQWIEGRADVLISTLSFALGEVNTGNVTQSRRSAELPRTAGHSSHPGDCQRHAARSLGGIPPRAQCAGYGCQRCDPGVRRTHHLGAGLLQRARREAPRASMLRTRNERSESPASPLVWRGCGAPRIVIDESRSC